MCFTTKAVGPNGDIRRWWVCGDNRRLRYYICTTEIYLGVPYLPLFKCKTPILIISCIHFNWEHEGISVSYECGLHSSLPVAAVNPTKLPNVFAVCALGIVSPACAVYPEDLGCCQNSTSSRPSSDAHSRPTPRAWPAPFSSSALPASSPASGPTPSASLGTSSRLLPSGSSFHSLLRPSPHFIRHFLHPVFHHTPVLNPLNLSRPFFLPNL